METKSSRRAFFKRSATVALGVAAGVLAPIAFDKKNPIKIGKLEIPTPSISEAHAYCQCGTGMNCGGAGQ